MADVVVVLTEVDIASVKALFLEYADALDVDLCFQGFDEEMASFPGRYAPPGGCLLLALAQGAPAGAVGLRPLGETPDRAGLCEMKRLYVRPALRGRGLGLALTGALVGRARELGYSTMRLDTLPSMTAAMALYRALGFVEIPAYYDSPPDHMHFELTLGATHVAGASAQEVA